MNKSLCEIGYCTNVHAGVTIDEIKSNLDEYAVSVKKSFSPDHDMGIGLWLCNNACQELIRSNRILEFAGWLNSRGLKPFTFNGFPYDDFHQPVVKHRVYEPAWAEQSRLDFTIAIASIQAKLLPEDSFGSISTLPLGWSSVESTEFLEQCSRHLIQCSNSLAALKETSGRHIVLCIEPEPGCVLDTSEKLVQFFSQHLFGKNENQNDRIRDHLGVCHDVCHSAVMFEPQKNALKSYRDHGIRIGKVQISSAVQAVFEGKSEIEKLTMIDFLNQFAEDRYLHQTTVWDPRTQRTQFFEDLPLALNEHSDDPGGHWRIHFHVPIFADQLAVLETTTTANQECLRQLVPEPGCPFHFEIETYAWTVLPKFLCPKSLSEGIARELIYFRDSCLPLIDGVR